MENYIEIIGEWINPDMSLYNPESPYVDWVPENKVINLNGNFTADQLRGLAWYMERGKNALKQS